MPTRVVHTEDGASSSRLGMGPPVEAGSREVKACRGGDVVMSGVQVILMALAEIGILIYPRGLAFGITDSSELPSHDD